MGKLIEFLKRLKSEVLRGREATKEIERIEKKREEMMNKWRGQIIRYRARNLPKPGSQASRQDISKFFKGKSRQASWYRKQIKRKIAPEEEET